MQTEQIVALHEAGLRVLAETGVLIRDDAAVRLFADRGCRADGARVFIPEQIVAAAVESAPSTVRIEGRGDHPGVTIGGGPSVVGPASGAALIAEGDRLRPLTIDDVTTFVRLCHGLPNVDVLDYLLAEEYGGTRDADGGPGGARDLFLRSVLASLTGTDKPYEFPITEPWHLPAALDIEEILYGAGWESQPRLFAVLNTTSPLMLTGLTCTAAMELARRGQPQCLTPCVMGGTTGPATVAGLLTVQHAETLAGLVLNQLAAPGAPFIYGGLSSVSSMQTGELMLGAPQFWTVIAATVGLAKHLGLPSRTGGAITDAHVPDMQAGIESALALGYAIEQGVDYVLHGSGGLSSLNAVSFAKLVIDDELVGMLRARPRELVIDDEQLALATIHAVGPAGSYLSQKHTRKHARDHLQPTVFNRRSHDAWTAAGAPDVSTAAQSRVDELLASYEPPALDAVVRRQLTRYCLED
jgi:trimethylamine--corrinoid protein Co-methyltransferase